MTLIMGYSFYQIIDCGLFFDEIVPESWRINDSYVWQGFVSEEMSKIEASFFCHRSILKD